ncbi:MAG TPA: Npt1/Npt2 family nucleotide transporter [Chlamydiales bacterium]|nr:Npt1/Npt2 family nucleotide transporter [Chlamydiales bacterium]
MQQLFRKVFGVYSGEGRQALQFARLAIFWAFGCSCLDTLSDGLFIEKVGAASLLRVYFGVAIALIATSSLVFYGLRKLSPYQILMSVFGIAATVCITSAIFVSGDTPTWFWYALKIVSRIFYLVVLPLMWTFTDQYHDLQDAKRVYALYNGTYYIGAIISGMSINFLLDTLGFTTLLCAAFIAIILGMREARLITRVTKAIHDDSTEGVMSSNRDSLVTMVKQILRSKYVICLLLLAIFSQLLQTVTDFNCMATFGEAFKGERHITEFLGKSRAIIAFANIFIAMFIYNRCIRRIGVNNAILVTPLFFVAVYVGWLFYDGLPTAILGLVAIEGFLYGFDENSTNLMTNAAPSKLKSKVRILIGSFFEPTGMLISAALMSTFEESTRGLGLLITVFVLVFAFAVRTLYSSAILSNLKENALHFDRKLKTWLALMTRREQKEAKKAILKALKSPHEDFQLLGAKSLLEMGDANHLDEILFSARKFGTVAKIQLLQLLEHSIFHNHTNVIQTIDAWTESDSPELAKHANFYLAKKGLHHPEKAEEDLEEPDLILRSAAILTLKKSLANSSLETAALNRTIASKKLDIMLQSSRIDEIGMALDLIAEENTPERALPFLNHDSKLVKRAAARTIAASATKSFSRHAPRLIEELENSRDSGMRLSLLDALGKIADTTIIKDLLLASIRFRPSERRRTEEIILHMGLKIVPLLLSLTKDIAIPERARILSGKILARLALPQLQSILPEILDIEIDRAYFYFYFAHTIQKQYPLYDLEMLQNALFAGYQSVIDFVIHLLGAAGSLEDPDLLVRALHNRNGKIHAHAIESLEKTCDARIFRLIAPLIDDLPLEEKMAACISWHGNSPNLTLSELLDKLDDSPLLFDKIVAVRLKTQLQMPNWRKELRELMKHSDETFHQYAYELLET